MTWQLKCHLPLTKVFLRSHEAFKLDKTKEFFLDKVLRFYGGKVG